MPFCYEDTLQTLPHPAFLFLYCSLPMVAHGLSRPGRLVRRGHRLSSFCIHGVRTWLWSQAACLPVPARPLPCDSGVVPHPWDFTVLICNLGMTPASEGSYECEFPHVEGFVWCLVHHRSQPPCWHPCRGSLKTLPQAFCLAGSVVMPYGETHCRWLKIWRR